MAASGGVHPYGSKLETSPDDVAAYATLGEMVDIDPPPETVDVGKATHLESDNAAKEKKPGMYDAGKLACTVNFVKGAYSTLRGYKRVTRYWRISAPLVGAEVTPSRWRGQGFWTLLQVLKIDPESDTVIQARIEIELTGEWVFTAGA